MKPYAPFNEAERFVIRTALPPLPLDEVRTKRALERARVELLRARESSRRIEAAPWWRRWFVRWQETRRLSREG